MRPHNLTTRIFLDGGDPAQTRRVIGALGFLDGQTTNPTLIAKNPEAAARLAKGLRFTPDEILDFYREVVTEISGLIPDGSVSIEVYADKNTSAGRMLAEAGRFFSWIANAHVKFPVTKAGLEAAGRAMAEGLRVNMTLCFTQEQAAAVYAATRGARRGDVFVSPFVGRLDDRGENGMDLIAGVARMFAGSDGHVELLSASVRTMEHFLYSLALGADIVTAPGSLLMQWAADGLPVPGADYAYPAGALRKIAYRELSLDKPLEEYDIAHELTVAGMERFSADWNALIKR
ncbi:MAG: transaldolase [Desulfovibrionaceae bacterium]|nr:transaldolase [Desulfovibrionaceae bacterium]